MLFNYLFGKKILREISCIRIHFLIWIYYIHNGNNLILIIKGNPNLKEHIYPMKEYDKNYDWIGSRRYIRNNTRDICNSV